LQTVLLNGRPFKVEFGGLPKPIIVRDKKHFIRFSVLPRGVRAGHVKITGMRGEGPIESPPPATPVIAQKPKVDTAPAPSTLPAVEHESTSQDGLEFTSTSKPGEKLTPLRILYTFFSYYDLITVDVTLTFFRFAIRYIIVSSAISDGAVIRLVVSS